MRSNSCRRRLAHAIQRQRFQLGASLFGEQLLLPAQTFAHGQGMQLIAHRVAHPHQLLPMPQQLPQIALFPSSAATAAETARSTAAPVSCAASRASVFCLRTAEARIRAASPIHNSCPNSASICSNQRVCPVASIPTRTGLGQCCVKLLRFSAGVLQTTLDQLASLVIQHRNLLVARMQITTYNLHVLGSFPPSLGCLSAPSLLGRLWSRHGYLIRPPATQSLDAWSAFKRELSYFIHCWTGGQLVCRLLPSLFPRTTY